MPVEFLSNGEWLQMDGASATHVEGNRYLVTVRGLPRYLRITALDGTPLRIGGQHESFQAWGTRRSGDELVLDVLVR